MAVDLQAIEQLATDQASLKAAAGVAKPAKWSGLCASQDKALIWGQCAGSGANPYRVMADLRDMGSKCTCPSRKFPCKHALALLLIRAQAIAPFVAAETPDWVSDWLGRRRPAAAAKPAAKTEGGEEKSFTAALSASPEPETDGKAVARREAASAKRAEENERAIRNGLDALEQWIGDQLRLGLGSFVGDVTARCRRIAARLVDGKAAALAGHIDELPARLLEQPPADRVRAAAVELGRLVMLARAYRAEPHQPEVRRAVAVTENRDALLADPRTMRMASVWEVLGEQTRTRRDGLVSQVTWLLNLQPDGPRFAMLLDYFPASAGRRGSVFVPGEQFAGELAFYPSRAPLRAVLLGREAAGDTMMAWPEQDEPLEQVLTAPWLGEPWAPAWPVLLPAGRVGFDRAGAAWWRGHDEAIALPIGGEVAGLITGTDLPRSAALWSGNRLELLAACTHWGRIGG